MSLSKGSAEKYIEVLMRKAPEYLDLLTAESDEEFENAFDSILEKAITNLEINKKNYETLDEEGLSGVLAGSMTIPGLSVSQEKHSGGHVDLTFEADHCFPVRTILGEAKIYKGPVYHISGLTQLISRYTTGRECRSLLIVYVRKKNIKGKFSKLRNTLDKELPLTQLGVTKNHSLKWSFLSKHKHSCGENLKVCHVGCNLYVE